MEFKVLCRVVGGAGGSDLGFDRVCLELGADTREVCGVALAGLEAFKDDGLLERY